MREAARFHALAREVAVYRKQQTANLGVRSSYLFGCAS